MKTTNFKKLIVLYSTIIFSINLIAQNSEQTVSAAENSINQKIAEVHQLARQRNIKDAFKKLDEINKEFNKEFTWGTFHEKFREAKLSNPNFDYQIREDLPEQLSISFWSDYIARCDKIMSDQSVITEGMASMVQLNNWDQAMAYGGQLKTMYETFTGAAENLGSANLLKFAYDLHGNMNDFIENYKKIEKAKLEGIEIQGFQVDFNRMTSKARKSKSLYKEYIEKIRKNQGMIVDFEYNIKHIHKLKNLASKGPLFPLSYADLRYNWNYEYFENELKEESDSFENYVIDCPEYTKFYNSTKADAREEWKKIKGNIYASDHEAKKQEFLTHHNGRWTEFLNQVKPIYENTYQIHCIDNSASDESQVDNPFDGATAGGSNKQDGESGNTDKPNNNSSELARISNMQVSVVRMDWIDGVGSIDVKFDVHFKRTFLGYVNVFVGKENKTKSTNLTTFPTGKTQKTISKRIGFGNVNSGNYKIKVLIEPQHSEAFFAITEITVHGKTITQGGTSSSEKSNTKEESSTQQIPTPQEDNASTGKAVVWNGGTGSSTNNSSNSSGGSKPKPPPKQTNNKSNIPSNATLIGTIYNDGNGKGAYKAIAVNELKMTDKIVFKKVSGEMKYVQLIWRKEGGSWETAYEGSKTEFTISKGFTKMPPSTTHLNFVVNAHHNRWSSNDIACKMNVYLVPGSSGSGDFYDLISKSIEAFDVNYWEEEQGARASSNPKQKSLDFLRKASTLINREASLNKRLEMVELLVSTSCDFGKRVHAYEYKTPFIELAGKTLNQASHQVSDASGYGKIANMWRIMTNATLWGDHAFNKMYCDKEQKKYQELSGR